MRMTEAPVLPPLPAQEYAQLRDSIRQRGVLQPLLITSDHVLIDGHERWRAIQELGLSRYPLRVLGNLSDGERVDLAIRTNLERRHLTVAQRRELAARLLDTRTDPAPSNRSVAGTVGCDHKTVGKVRGRLLRWGNPQGESGVHRAGRQDLPLPGHERRAPDGGPDRRPGAQQTWRRRTGGRGLTTNP